MYRRLLMCCFFLSGFASLLLEIIWAKELSYLIGNSLYAVATVLAAFMGGLGFGSWLGARYGPRLQKPVLFYGYLELGVAVFAIASLPLLRHSSPLFAAIYQNLGPGHWGFSVIRFLFVFLMLLIPTTLMGMSLPVIMGALTRGKSDFHNEAGWLYGLNTLGAVTGTAMAGFVLIPKLGLLQSSWLAAAAGSLVFAVALWLDAKLRPAKPDSLSGHTDSPWSSQMRWVAGLFLVGGMAAFIYEIAWFRILALIIGPSVYAFSAMLVAYLSGISLGSMLFTPWVGRLKHPMRMFAALELALGVLALSSIYFFNYLTELYGWLFHLVAEIDTALFPVAQLGLSIILVFIPCLVMGAVFPLVVSLFCGSDTSSEKSVGLLYLFNTVGAIAGSILGGFWLIPLFGIKTTLVLACALSFFIAFFIWFRCASYAVSKSIVYVSVSGLFFTVFVFFAPPIQTLKLSQGLYRYLASVEDVGKTQDILISQKTLLFHSEGRSASVLVERAGGEASLRITGKADAGTSPKDLYTQIFLGQVPLMFAPKQADVAVIGYGSGKTLHSVLTHSGVKRVDAIELEQAVIDASPFFQSINHDALDDSRTRLLVEDGRIHMMFSQNTYDVIISEPTNPWITGVNNLFTKEYYEIIQSRLTDDGVFCQWFQLYEISLNSFEVMIRTLSEVFPDITLYQTMSGDLICLASQEPLVTDWETFETRFNTPSVKNDFEVLGIKTPFEFLAFYIGTPDNIQDSLKISQVINTDDNAWLEYNMPSEMYEALEFNPQAAVLKRYSTNRLQHLQTLIPDIDLSRAAVEIPRFWYNPELKLDHEDSIDDFWYHERGIQMPLAMKELQALEMSEAEATLKKSLPQWISRLEKEVHALKLCRPIYENISTEPFDADMRNTLEEASALAPEAPLVQYLLGLKAISENDGESAIEHFKFIISKRSSPLYYEALLELSKLTSPEESRHLLQTCIHVNPYRPEGFLLLLNIMNTKDEDYSKVLQKALTFHPENSVFSKLMKSDMASP